MPDEFIGVPDWPWWENAGAGLAVADVDADGVPDLVVLAVDEAVGRNRGFFRVGAGFVDGTVTKGWAPWQEVPDWFPESNAGAGVAVADVDGDGALDLVVFMVDAPPGQNGGYYRVGHRLAADGTVTGGWGPWIAVPDWTFWETQGADVVVADVTGDGRLDLVVVMVDAPEGSNAGYYRVGRQLAADGTVTGGWGPWIAVPEWNFWENQGAGAAVVDLDGDGHLELVVFCVDNPVGNNGGFYTVGWGLDGTGRAVDGWGPWTRVDGWPFWENAGASIAVTQEQGSPGHQLVILTIDNPEQGNGAYHRATRLTTDLDTAAQRGVWRLLDFGTEVNPVHTALLHTGDVVFFAGSGNDEAKLAAHQFRTRVWRYPSAVLDAPDTPVDLFCCGQAFLADGRLLAAGGTEQYDPFHGLRDALAFDPAARAWSTATSMAGGRWYPSLATLPDGRVVAISGVGQDGNLTVVPEVYSPSDDAWTPLPSPGAWPMYCHLVLLADGRVFYTGGQYGGNNGVRPSVWDLSTGATTEVPGLSVPDLRNQSTSVLLPPAQDQRVMIIGGGASDMHVMVPAVAEAAVVDLSEATPHYQPVAPLHAARMHLTATLLPDRTVLVNGGAAMEENAAMAAFDAEIFDPVAGTWTVGATSRVPRLYHSVAVLVPDGRVVTAGSNPARRTEELRIEVYWPPYLFRGPRPTISLSDTTAGYGQDLTATVTGDRPLRWMSLVRPGAGTHSADNEQRLVDVAFTAQHGDEVRVELPASAALAPPGWYMLFAVDEAGVPSNAAWLRLG
ncbi:galactose oxidase-like domain-containing protein [Geodermatophilus sp. CPCC 205506]|uniref:galactose oxidase-like domain-containing protein n=1 Tax=Geodermatophilus sp. CPCC 205506 TaxID=2936596 RepID=UPI003EECF679